MMIGYDIYDCFTMEHFRLRPKFIARDCTYQKIEQYFLHTYVLNVITLL
jgi:hypothetical protein